MNNLQNRSGKCVSPPASVPNHNDTFSNYLKKTKGENETRSSGGLKIFFESKNFNVDEPRYEWSFRKVSKKNSRILALRKSAENKKKKSRKSDKKIKNEERDAEERYQRPHFLMESSSSKAKALGPSTKSVHQKKDILFSHYALRKNYLSRSPKSSEKYITDTDGSSLNNTFPSVKSKLDMQNVPEKLEITIRPRGSTFSTNQPLSRKTSEKVTTKQSEMKTTISDYGKRRINEILKNHAQKVQSTPVKTIQIKDYSIHADLQKKPPNYIVDDNEIPTRDAKETKIIVKSEDRKAEEKKSDEKKLEEKKVEEGKYISGETENKNLKEVKSQGEDKKKLPDVWMKLPQSNELERRLKNSWPDPGVQQTSHKESKLDKSSEEEKNSTAPEKEDDNKSEKRVTYTDRLLLLKMLGKNMEDKKQKAVTEDKQLKEANNAAKAAAAAEAAKNSKTETLSVKPENLMAYRLEPKVERNTPKESPVKESNDMVLQKESKYSETENIYKAKPTRSTELRDLVSQAIKEHKIFCIFDNHTYIVRPVREELLSRGWLEVIPDRRLIPRRRPPPMGPVFERERALNERNCNTLEAILAAKETFADEIQETVSRSSFKFGVEKPRVIVTPIGGGNKKSEESLSETLSEFRITPPTAERKKNNCDIRDFVSKYQTYVEKERQREKEIKNLREKEKNAKILKKEKPSRSSNNSNQRGRSEEKPDSPEEIKYLIGSKSFQELWESINDNKKVIMQATTEIKNMEDKMGGKLSLGPLYDSVKKLPAIEDKKEKPTAKQKATSTVQGTAPKIFFSDSEAKTISKIIQSSNARIHFMWLSIKPGIHLKCFNYSPEIVNKFQKTTFCTKIGLWSHLNNMQWYAHEVHHPAKSPRMYNTGEADDLQAFFQDFQLTACIGMLKWLSDTFFERGLKAVQTKKGKVPLKAFEFAIKQCENYIRFKDNEELNSPEDPSLHQEEWNTFLQWFYIITNDHGKLQESSSAQLMVVYTKAVETLKMMKRHWPEMDIDGRLNIWIMKPYCASCGRGIFMTNNVYYISQHSKYIVQKYIEKPLLIYNTKFDIRQWFMITKLTPLEIWMYKECYLRFCSQPFVLRNLHESVHLSNNSVQRKYVSLRDPALPDQNMWDSKTFQLYLKTIGHPHAWEEIIYPGMRDAIVSTMLAAQDTFDGPRKSWFEVYGADFMLSANVKDGPWLIEINENPAMDPSTKVTARLCPQMLRDVIKVVVDKRANKNASTGQWELIYRQNYSPSFGTVDLDVRGKKISRVPFSTKVSLNVIPEHPTISKIIKSTNVERVGLTQLYEVIRSIDQHTKEKVNYEKPHDGRLRNEKRGLRIIPWTTRV